MRMTITVTHKDDVYEVRPTAGDMVRFERIHNKPISKLDDGRITDLAWLAWSYAHRNHKTTDPFEKWVEDLDDLDFEDVGAPSPLGPAPSPG